MDGSPERGRLVVRNNQPLMFVLATDLTDLLLDEETIAYVAELGSSTPHSVMIDGCLEELLDAPTFNVAAGAEPVILTEASFI